MVHITATGKKYHRAGCRTLKKSDTEVTLDEAKIHGLVSVRKFAIHHSRCALAFASHDIARVYAYAFDERIAKPLRYCRIMHMKHRNDLPWRASRGEPRHGRRVFDGFVKHRSVKKHNPYSILAAKRSESKAMRVLWRCRGLQPV